MSADTARKNGWSLEFSRRISLGDVIKIVILTVAAVAGYFAIDNRLALVECAVAEQKNFITRDVHELSLKNIETQLGEMNRRLGGIERKMDARYRGNDIYGARE